jgi:RNA polymerase sigma factor (sigma-70 family)
MLGGRDEAEDALQQTFIRAHRALIGGTLPRELRPWLYGIAGNCCRTIAAERRPVVRLEAKDPGVGDLGEEVARREDLRDLVRDLGRLPADQRSALLLSELEDRSHIEVAEILGCRAGKVKALVYQARSALLADRRAREASCVQIREDLAVAGEASSAGGRSDATSGCALRVGTSRRRSATSDGRWRSSFRSWPRPASEPEFSLLSGQGTRRSGWRAPPAPKLV